MKHFSFLFVAFLQPSLLFAHGFSANTLVLVANNGWQQINTVCHRVQKKKVPIASYDTTSLYQTIAHAIRGGQSKTNCYVRIGFDEQYKNTHCFNDLTCTPTQEFYLAQTRQWIPAYLLKIGDELVCADNNIKVVACISFIKEPLDIFTIEVKHTHTFFVTQHSILTHNMVLPVAFNIGLSIPFGASTGGAAGSFFGPITFVLGTAVGCMVGALVKIACDGRMPRYAVDLYDTNTFEQQIKQQPKISTFTEPEVAFSPNYTATATQKLPIDTCGKYVFDNNDTDESFSITIQNQPKEKPGCGDTAPQKPLIYVTPADPIPAFQNPGYIPLSDEERKMFSGGCTIIPIPESEKGSTILFTEGKTAEEVVSIIDDFKKRAKPGKETNGKSTQYIKEGDFEDAKKDFESLTPSNVRPIPNGLAGNLPDGRTINIRMKSSEGSPTLEIYNPVNRRMIKFRYKSNP